MLRALDCSAFMPSPPRTFSDSVGFTPVPAPLGTVYQRFGRLPSPPRGWPDHRPASCTVQDWVASQSPLPNLDSRLSTLPIQTYDGTLVLDALAPGSEASRSTIAQAMTFA